MPQKDVAASYINYLRNASKLRCPHCGEEFPDIDERIRNHLQSRHPELVRNDNIAQLVQDIRKGSAEAVKRTSADKQQQQQLLSSQDPGGGRAGPSGDKDQGNDVSPHKRRKSPDSSIKGRTQSASPHRRSRARAVSTSANDPDFRRTTHLGKLWSPDDVPSSSSPRPNQLSHQTRNISQPRNRSDAVEDESESTRLIKQPETRPISQEQLIAEVKGIYAGLVMVESKCIEVDNAQQSQNETQLNNEQWQALIALHRTLLHEHHDFFLASQHPSASQALRRLASKYAMPARMWRHGIHSFLELLRHRLPHSLEHMLTFIYLAYSMMALLYETVPAFEDTWIECLGDLGRYRMAIEDDDIRDREVWTSVSRHWYSKASDKAPTTGRLYHHLAILARPNPLQQLYYYTKSLCVPIPFSSARESIMTLFDPILDPNSIQHSRLSAVDVAFVKAHGILFSNKHTDEFLFTVDKFSSMLDNQIGRTTRKWMESGYYIAISDCNGLLSYGQDNNVILKAIRPQHPEDMTESGTGEENTPREYKPSRTEEGALKLFDVTCDVVLRRFGDFNILPFLHVVLVFIFHLTHYPNALFFIEKTVPWKLVSLQLNSLLLSYREHHRIHSEQFPRQDKELAPRPLPEDFAMKGLVWVDKYFPNDWFSNDKIDDDEKYFEVASMTGERKERIIWLGCRIAKLGKWLTYDEALHKFGVATEYDTEIESTAKDTDMLNVSETSETVSRASTSDSTTTMGNTPSEKDDEDMIDVDKVLEHKPIIRQ
ncbi:uncharacterized protein F4812DRAFT_454293 [Daldinia caldariorum]|uniref:uncharacterized protein n=1 Tax=Daldinia caldariorum TaxID=326644 RepID=UPI002007D1E7|nr:uncharacterized protein F4812DRAFT_454293 [Daldinia caldariorum]KAI1472479.1 hypothetical protein F4812DRAFT_454293 [Daldinia caldariorum]